MGGKLGLLRQHALESGFSTSRIAIAWFGRKPQSAKQQACRRAPCRLVASATMSLRACQLRVGRSSRLSGSGSRSAVSPGMACFSDNHAPRSINLQRSLQNGRNGEFAQSISRRHVGHFTIWGLIRCSSSKQRARLLRSAKSGSRDPSRPESAHCNGNDCR